MSRHIRLLVLLVPLVVCGGARAVTPVADGRLNEVMVDDFEDGILHLYPNSLNADGFGYHPNPNAGQFTWALDPTVGANGSSKSMKLTVQTTVPYWWYKSGSKQDYILGNYGKPLNRMEFYIKLPAGWKRSSYLLSDDRTYSNYNFHIGTYERDPNVIMPSDVSETWGWHFYYYLLFNAYDGEWARVVVNKWVQHKRDCYYDPGFNPCRPRADLFDHWNWVYFTGTGETTPAEVEYPYNIWFDQWCFYYERDYMTVQPEYGQAEVVPGTAHTYPVVVTNTHPTESREFGLLLSSMLGSRTDGYWCYNVHLYTDANANGIRDAGENTEPASTGMLAPGQKWYGCVVVTIPASGAGSHVGDTVATALRVWQQTPAYVPDPHMSMSRAKVGGVVQDAAPADGGIHRGAPMVGTQFTTSIVSTAPAADTIAPAAIADLRLLAIGPHDVKIQWTAVGDDGMEEGTAHSYEARYSTSPISPANWDSAIPVTGEPDAWPLGTSQTWWFPPEFEPDTTYYLAIRVYDEQGNVSGLSDVLQFTTAGPQADNAAPVAALSADVTTGPTPLAVHFSSAGSSDSDGSIALYVWELGDGRVSNEANPTCTFDLVETHTVKLTVFDNGGASHSQSLTINPTRGPRGRIRLRYGVNGYNSGLQNMIRQANPTNVYCPGYNEHNAIGANGPQRTLYQFLNYTAALAIPSGSTIQQAKVLLRKASELSTVPPALELYRIDQAYTAQQTSWTNSASGTPWSTAGALPAGAVPNGYTRPDRHALYWYSFDVTDLVTAGEPVQLALRHQYETDTSGGYYRETRVNHHGATVEKRPTLLVTYAITGDIDGDGSVNVFDIFCIAEAWNTVRGDANFNPACDLDGDGSVNVFDIFVVAENWNRS